MLTHNRSICYKEYYSQLSSSIFLLSSWFVWAGYAAFGLFMKAHKPLSNVVNKVWGWKKTKQKTCTAAGNHLMVDAPPNITHCWFDAFFLSCLLFLLKLITSTCQHAFDPWGAHTLISAQARPYCNKSNVLLSLPLQGAKFAPPLWIHSLWFAAVV